LPCYYAGSRLQNYQPSHVLYIPGQIAGIIGKARFMNRHGGADNFPSGVVGLFIYRFYGRIRQFGIRSSAYHRRVTARELTTHSLETELKKSSERDEIVQDRFDRIVERRGAGY
jgi:hypothetical protein